MADRALTTAEAAQALGVHVNTVKSWLIQLPVPAQKDPSGRWRVGLQALEVLQAIKRMRDQDRTFETIRQRLDPDEGDYVAVAQTITVELADDDEDYPSRSAEGQGRFAEGVGAVLVPRVVEVLDQQSKLAEKLARSAHQIGRLEAELDGARLSLAEAKMEIAALRARRWWERILYQD